MDHTLHKRDSSLNEDIIHCIDYENDMNSKINLNNFQCDFVQLHSYFPLLSIPTISFDLIVIAFAIPNYARVHSHYSKIYICYKILCVCLCLYICIKYYICLYLCVFEVLGKPYFCSLHFQWNCMA